MVGVAPVFCVNAVIYASTIALRLSAYVPAAPVGCAHVRSAAPASLLVVATCLARSSDLILAVTEASLNVDAPSSDALIPSKFVISTPDLAYIMELFALPICAPPGARIRSLTCYMYCKPILQKHQIFLL